MKNKNPNWETVDENLQWERIVANKLEPDKPKKIKRIAATKIRRFNGIPTKKNKN